MSKNPKNFNEIFRKDVTYDNLKSHKKPGLRAFSRRYIFGKSLEDTFFKKLQGGQLAIVFLTT